MYEVVQISDRQHHCRSVSQRSQSMIRNTVLWQNSLLPRKSQWDALGLTV